VVLVVVNLIVVMTRQPALFCFALICNLVLLYFCIPVLLGWSGEIDPRGRFSSIMMGTVTLVTALSPSVAGEFVDHWGLASLTRVVAITGILFIALLLLIPLIRSRPGATVPLE
jgi:predicted MFS family arabinose efflux permease